MENDKTDKVVYINTCNHCGKLIKNEWKFCPYCKFAIETFRCNYCEQEIRSNWNYCPSCKNEIKTELENRQRFDKSNEWLRDILKSREI